MGQNRRAQDRERAAAEAAAKAKRVEAERGAVTEAQKIVARQAGGRVGTLRIEPYRSKSPAQCGASFSRAVDSRKGTN